MELGLEIVENPIVPEGWIVMRGAREIIAAVPDDAGGYRVITYQIPSPFAPRFRPVGMGGKVRNCGVYSGACLTAPPLSSTTELLRISALRASIGSRKKVR